MSDGETVSDASLGTSLVRTSALKPNIFVFDPIIILLYFSKSPFSPAIILYESSRVGMSPLSITSPSFMYVM